MSRAVECEVENVALEFSLVSDAGGAVSTVDGSVTSQWLPFFPVPDRDGSGFFPVNDSQTVEQMSVYFAAAFGKRRAAIVEMFKSTLAELKSRTDWDGLSERQKYARLLRAMGFGSKAERALDCHDTGIRGACSCGLEFYNRYRCTLRFCGHCAPWHFARLMDRYATPIAGFSFVLVVVSETRLPC